MNTIFDNFLKNVKLKKYKIEKIKIYKIEKIKK